MERWEIALEKFMKDWKNKKGVIGALVCGSFVTGNPSKHSDIDLHILLDDSIKWRERGNKIINGILVEYFANPLRMHYEYLKEDYKDNLKTNAHMFLSGKILFDKTGQIKKLINDSKRHFKKKFKKIPSSLVEIKKYHLWDLMDNLLEAFGKNAPDCEFIYFSSLNKLFDDYCKFLGNEIYPVHKILRFLSNQVDKKKYLLDDFPDNEFKILFLKAIKAKKIENMPKIYAKLTNHILDKMGSFDIDGWKTRTPAKPA